MRLLVIVAIVCFLPQKQLAQFNYLFISAANSFIELTTMKGLNNNYNTDF